MENKYTNLIGYSENTVKDLHSVEEVAEFICEEGMSGDVEIITPVPPVCKGDGCILAIVINLLC